METGKRYDVFLSHNSSDKPLVEQIAKKLTNAGLTPWLDKWYLTANEPFAYQLGDGLRASASCVAFIGPNGFGNWQRDELAAAQSRATRDRSFPFFAVLLPGAPDPFDYSTLPFFLSIRNAIDLRKGIEDPTAFQDLINAIQGTAPGPRTPVEPRQDICPYRGLEKFDEEHARFFFGRDADIQRLIEKLKSTRFLAVVGPSGSGKSSLVRAGLIPALRQGKLPGSHTWTIGPPFAPGAQPLTTLAAHLLRVYPHDTMQKTLDGMMTDERTLHLATVLALAERPAEQRLIWVIDQFEELFTLCHDEQQRAQFLSNLLYASSIPDGRTIVVLTLRADFYPKCATYPVLSAHIAAQQFLVSPLNLDGLRQVIAEPARCVGLEPETGLIDTILDDVGNAPGRLPLLEHALLELWNRRLGRQLTLAGYRESGGVEGAIAKRAETIYDDFTPEQQSIARRVMLRLTQPGEGTEDTRRHAAMSELEGDAVAGVVRTLTDARLLTTSADERTGEQWVDVSHEALIRGWPRLREWLDQDREGLRIHHRLTEATQQWQRLKRDEGALYRGIQLLETIDWRAKNETLLNDQEREFLDASVALKTREEEAEKEEQRLKLKAAQELAKTAQARAHAERRLRIVSTLVILIASLFLVGIGIVSYEPARREWVRQQAFGPALISIPASEPVLGEQNNVAGQDAHYLPWGKQTVGAFRIEPYEVTNERFLLCVNASACLAPFAPLSSYRDADKAQLPVSNVNLVQANQFCAWLGRRLPTDIEWERAARYTDGRRMPWGNSMPTPEQANFFFDTEQPLQPVGHYPKGRSYEGVSDLAGNVWEWTRSYYDYDQESRIWSGNIAELSNASFSVRGGGIDTSVSAINNTLAYRLSTDGFSWDPAIGFRCVAD